MKTLGIGFGTLWIASFFMGIPILAAASESPTTNVLGASAAEDYALHCSACHRADGSGVSELVPSLRDLTPLLALPRGREYLVRVPGVSQAPLSPPRLARLLNWVVAEYSGLDLEPRFSAAEVEALRTSPLRDPTGFRSALTTPTEVAESVD
jgi:mono/diheme cytochrome c family protein